LLGKDRLSHLPIRFKEALAQLGQLDVVFRRTNKFQNLGSLHNANSLAEVFADLVGDIIDVVQIGRIVKDADQTQDLVNTNRRD
jgi:hypothetical protein